MDDGNLLLSQDDEEMLKRLSRGLKEDDDKIPAVFWPHISDAAVSEYEVGVRLYACAFPWLFPGGIGDFNEEFKSRTLTVGDWAERLLFYKDGRFSTDKMWCFYALNYVTRRRNQDQGSFFVEGFYKDSPLSITEIQDEIKKGNQSFIDKISYYSKKVRGSAGYWRAKKAELYSWIHHHVEQGHGMPSFFITLSCAEYYWPDIIRLLNERLALAGHPQAVSRVEIVSRVVTGQQSNTFVLTGDSNAGDGQFSTATG